MKIFTHKFFSNEYYRIKAKTCPQSDSWYLCLNGIRGNIKIKSKRRAWENGKVNIIHKTWNEFFIMNYRSILAKAVSNHNRKHDKSFERIILIWHNRLRGYYNSRFIKQERKTSLLTDDEIKWRYNLEKMHSKLLIKRDMVGWKRLIDYSYRYILKAEKRKHGTIPREKVFCKTWNERLRNIKENLIRRHERKIDGWVKRFDQIHSHLITREKMRLGVLKNG